MSPSSDTYLVTGATSGVGRDAVLRLARAGFRVLLHARTPEKGDPVAKDIRAESGNQAVEVVAADFSRLREVRRLAEEVQARAPELTGLLNNAGLVRDQETITDDGFELTLQVNHLAPFLLTRELLEGLRARGGRVVTVASAAHRRASLPADGLGAYLRGEGRFQGLQRYSDSKLANILFTRELARRAPEITTYSVHPGVLATGIWDRNRGLLSRLVRLFKPLMGDPDVGGQAAVQLLLEESDAPSGSYFDKEERADPKLPDDPDGVARALWAASEAAVAEG